MNLGVVFCKTCTQLAGTVHQVCCLLNWGSAGFLCSGLSRCWGRSVFYFKTFFVKLHTTTFALPRRDICGKLFLRLDVKQRSLTKLLTFLLRLFGFGFVRRPGFFSRDVWQHAVNQFRNTSVACLRNLGGSIGLTHGFVASKFELALDLRKCVFKRCRLGAHQLQRF